MPSEKAVREVMLPLDECPTVMQNDTVQEAVNVLLRGMQAGHQCVLILDDDRKPVGILSSRTLLQTLEPDFVVTPNWSLPVFWPGFLSAKCRQEARRKVQEIMDPIDVLAVRAGDPLTRAVHAMVSNNVGALPVVEGDRVLGLVRLTEVFNEIGHLFTSESEEQGRVKKDHA
ncbi:MAG: CBS domain-containing protein [Bacillota bacterium]|uniref:CBS domain-containing protein n=1 Tax=Desulforudis sp. DRI-14 TaxID=3459793 RepID=UPI00348D4282